MTTLVFDIETVPDVRLGRKILGIAAGELSDAEVAKAMLTRRRQQTGDEFLPPLCHRIVAIACALRSRDGLKLWSLGDPQSSEGELVERFFEGIERFSPVLVSWNGAGFDLPVLHYRALRAGVRAPRYWETGEEDVAFRYNNYLSRYHWRHIDLMDVLSGFQGRARASLADAAALLGFPGKLGFDGSQVWDAWSAGERVRIRQYCETDVLNTYLVYLRFELYRGRFSRERHDEEVARVKALLAEGGAPHHVEFLRAWEASAAELGD
ncbi:MAG: 3'-5' exonuclease [Steroidobacteraceae bacterium]